MVIGAVGTVVPTRRRKMDKGLVIGFIILGAMLVAIAGFVLAIIARGRAKPDQQIGTPAISALPAVSAAPAHIDPAQPSTVLQEELPQEGMFKHKAEGKLAPWTAWQTPVWAEGKGELLEIIAKLLRSGEINKIDLLPNTVIVSANAWKTWKTDERLAVAEAMSMMFYWKGCGERVSFWTMDDDDVVSSEEIAWFTQAAGYHEDQKAAHSRMPGASHVEIAAALPRK